MTDLQQLERRYQDLAAQNLSLDLTRGKPCGAQLDLANGLDGALGGDYRSEDGTDVRNYGGLLGLIEARRLGAEMLGTDIDEVLCAGNSSLTLMFLYAAFGHVYGFGDPRESWQAEATASGRPARFLCPVPGYDRHFTVCERLGIAMTTVPMLETGPDMDAVETAVDADPMIKGIWCVPRYSNPTGVTYNSETVRRLAALPARAGRGFRVFWDNAYAVHHLTTTPAPLDDIMPIARSAGTADGLVMFASTAKITFAGAGIAWLATSPGNLAAFADFLSTMTIGPDKVNQLRHVRFLAAAGGLAAHMGRHAEILKPKFDLVQEILARDLGNLGIASWTRPAGGYFVSLDTKPGLARATVQLAGDLGVKLTPAGATFPYGNDPDDRNIRIAPTFAEHDELRQALEALTLCVRLAAARQATQST